MHESMYVTYGGRTMLRVRGGDGTGEQGGEAASGAQEASQGVDPQLAETVAGIQSQIGEMAPAMQQFAEAWPQMQERLNPAQEPGPDPLEQFADSFLDSLGLGDAGQQQQGQGPEPYGYGPEQQQGPQMNPETLRSTLMDGLKPVVQGMLEEALGPVRGQLGEITDGQRREQVNALSRELPQLADPEFTESFVPYVHEQALQLFGEERARDMALNPAFIRQAYFAQMGEMAARGETPALPDQQAAIETGHGASPAQGQVDRGDAIVSAGSNNGWNPGGP